MCVIIDANLASNVLSSSCNENFIQVIKWVLEKDGKIVLGGKLAEEIGKLEKPRRFLKALSDAGKARLISKSEVEAEDAVVKSMALCCSNDTHVIALARVSGARLLCSYDKDLHTDFKNKDLIDKPRGSVYTCADHAPLLKHSSSCGQARRRR